MHERHIHVLHVFCYFSKTVLRRPSRRLFFVLSSSLQSYFTLYMICWLLSNPGYRLQQVVAILLVFFFSFATIFICISAKATLLSMFRHAFQGIENQDFKINRKLCMLIVSMLIIPQ